MFPDKKKAYEDMMLEKRFKEQNPTADPSEAKSIPREFKELKSQ